MYFYLYLDRTLKGGSIMGNIIDLTKKAGIVLEKKNLLGVTAEVVTATDVSGSMQNLFAYGDVQETLDRLLGVGMNMDVNKAIDIFAFNGSGKHIGVANERNHQNFVKDVFLTKTRVDGGTNYAPVMELIINKYGTEKPRVKKGLFAKLFGKKTAPAPKSIPTFVFFLTDGENWDKEETIHLLRETSNQPIFWQFIGIGNEKFEFLRKLDDLDGRFIDNAGFFHVNDIERISDEELYDRLLNEFPSWLKEAKAKGVLI